jgi:hypothetical protein
MKWQTVDKQINTTVIFDLDNYTIEAFNELPKFIRKEISLSIEWSCSEYDEEFVMLKKIDPPKKVNILTPPFMNRQSD